MSTILLDKSAFQALSLDDMRTMGASEGKDQLLATDVLLLELLGDLRYEDGRTAALSRKLGTNRLRLRVNMPSHLLCGNELLGGTVPLVGVPVLEGYEVRDSAGNRGVYVPPSQGDRDLLRWAQGEFDEQDLDIARTWTEGVKNFPLGDLERDIRLGLPRAQRPASMEDIVSAVDQALSDREMQECLLEVMLAYLFLPDEWLAPIRRRWSRRDLLLLRDAPYTAFCARVTFLFIGAVGGGWVGTRRSNFVDAQYLMYLPFCDMFASGDRLHATLFPFICFPGQSLLSAGGLKERLNGMTQSAPNAGVRAGG